MDIMAETNVTPFLWLKYASYKTGTRRWRWEGDRGVGGRGWWGGGVGGGVLVGRTLGKLSYVALVFGYA